MQPPHKLRNCKQVTSKRVANAKSDKYHGNILKRGKVELQKVRGPLRDCCNVPSPPPAKFERGCPVAHGLL